MDIKSPAARSLNMSKIRSTNTKPEIYIRSMLHKCGLRYRINYSAIEGRPDLFFPKYKTAVFVHGCYWHRHKNCSLAYVPKTNVDFWMKKLEGNRQHDERVLADLQKQGIRVLVIWECTIRKMRKDISLEKEVCDILYTFITERNEMFSEV